MQIHVLSYILIGAWQALAQLETASTTDLVAELEAGSDKTSVMQELGRRSADPKASSALEQAFRSAQDIDRKKQIAFAVSLGKRLEPWMYREIESFAAEAIGSGSPPMLRFDSAGLPVRGEVTVEYSEWCRLQGLAESDCVGRHMQRKHHINTTSQRAFTRRIVRACGKCKRNDGITGSR